MNWSPRLIVLAVAFATASPLRADGPPFASVAEIQATHDRALIKELVTYLNKSPKPDDADQAIADFLLDIKLDDE